MMLFVRSSARRRTRGYKASHWTGRRASHPARKCHTQARRGKKGGEGELEHKWQWPYGDAPY
eukprot:5402937-Pyramimonas_sp.AAC.1